MPVIREDRMAMLENFRQETRAWIAENCPEGARGPGQIPFGSRKVELEADVAAWLAAMVSRGPRPTVVLG